MCGAQSVVIDGKVYFGGGEAQNKDHCYLVHCYNPSQDKWTTLPPLPVRYFGLGHNNGKLVAVGGEVDSSISKQLARNSKDVCTFDSEAWKQTIPPMSLARLRPAVISHKSMLIVAGGEHLDEVIKTVEIFRQSQWYKTPMNSLPAPCFELSIAFSGSENKYYVLGGKDSQWNLNQVMYMSPDDLHCNTKPYGTTDDTLKRKSTENTSSLVDDLRRRATLDREQQMINCPWKLLPSTPMYSPAAATVAGSLIAVGGWERSDGGAVQTKILKYSTDTNSWIYLCDLPPPLARKAKTTTASISSTEFLVIGGCMGWGGRCVSRTVYKLTLHLK